MALNVAINGFGRIGRLVVRAAKTRKVAIDFVAVNDLTDAATLAHLLKYDTVHRVWREASGKAVDGKLSIGGDSIAVLSEKDPRSEERRVGKEGRFRRWAESRIKKE